MEDPEEEEFEEDIEEEEEEDNEEELLGTSKNIFLEFDCWWGRRYNDLTKFLAL